MRKQKKVVLWIIGSVFILLLLLTGGFVLFLPHLVDMKPIRERILLRLPEELGAG